MILIGLCYVLGLCHSFKSCALPPSLLFHALFMSPIWAHNVASTIFWWDKPENSWPLGRKYCITSNPSRDSGLHLPCFLQQMWQQHLSVNPVGQVTGTQMPARSPSVSGIPSRAIGLPRTTFATLEVSPTGHLCPNPYHPSPKAANIPPDQISTPLLWNSWSLASYHFALKPLTNSYNLPPLQGTSSSTQPVIKALLTPLTGPVNPLLCHYFCYYLEWVYDNKMFTIGDTLNCSYGGLEEEISDLYHLKRIRLGAILPGSQSQGTGLDCFTSWYLPILGGQTSNELRLQPLNPTQH